MALPRAPKAGEERPGPDIAMDAMAQAYPVLTEFLVLGNWPDGAARERGSLLIIWEDGWWKVWLNDRDGQRSAWLSAESLTGLLRCVDAALAEDKVQWRASTPQTRTRR